ncbi:hypothetical protein QMK17_11555 [Rhodococcus sp. G-MC3]|nr:hypothetical protein [Rhodococcus sp. G-MC3]MDJ0393967.1 hypothetical protein [Rhodococcus sp. G-MC3]
MPSHDEQGSTEQQHDDVSRAQQQRARLARIFGDVLPESTGDDKPDGADARSDDWFTSERPPHHT